jgi:hypothetical protein
VMGGLKGMTRMFEVRKKIFEERGIRYNEG